MLTHKVHYNPHIHIAKNFMALIHAAFSTKTEQPFSKVHITDASIQIAQAVIKPSDKQAVLERIEREIPGARRATDSAGRECDIAIDHSEFTHLPPEQIAQVVQIMQSEGLQATVSSIHINGWFGAHNKLEGARWIVRELLGRDLDAEIDRWVYVGDSTNDQLMFGAFPLSVGVANLRRFAAQLHTWPAYITAGERGEGFAEVAGALLASR